MSSVPEEWLDDDNYRRPHCENGYCVLCHEQKLPCFVIADAENWGEDAFCARCLRAALAMLEEQCPTPRAEPPSADAGNSVDV